MSSIPSSQPFTQRINQIDPIELIQRKLANVHCTLAIEERIVLLIGCIKLGEEQVALADRSAAERPIVFLGNTGCGKSTLINYLAGCEMEFIGEELARSFGIESLAELVVVKNTSEQPEVMKIGHSKISETFMPDIKSIGGRAYCDCPGFGDNRGVEINVANVVNTRRVILGNHGTRLVILINYHALMADKAVGLKTTINIAKQIFGNERIFQTHKNSILVGITQVPELSRRQSQRPLESLKSWLVSEDGGQLDSFEREIIQSFAQRLFIYHPLDMVNELNWDGGLRRHDLLNTLDQMGEIYSPNEVFSIALTADDEKGLREICEEMAKKIEESLKNKYYEDANLLLEYAYKIKQVDHPRVTAFVELCRDSIVKHFSLLIQEIDRELASKPQNLTPRAQELFQIISEGISSFGEDMEYFSEKIGLQSLKSRYTTHKKRIQFFERESILQSLENQFREKCFAFDFENADQLLQKIKEEVVKINHDFREESLSSKIDLSSLESLLNHSKARKTEIENIKKAQEEERKNFNAKLIQTQEMARREMENSRLANAAQIKAAQEANAMERKKLREEAENSKKRIVALQNQVNQLQSSQGGGGGGRRKCVII